MLLKGLMVVAAMLVCLSASAIDKVVKSTGLDNEVTSLEELKSKKVILQNADGKMLYIPGVGGETSWDFKMTDLVNGLTSNNGAFLSAIDYDGHLIFQVFNLNGDERATPGWAGGKAYLNTQPEGQNVIFGLAGMNDKHGQDGPNLAVWDVEYVEGQGFSFHNVGRDIYLGYDATDARPSTSVVYWKAFTAYHAGYVQTEVEAAYEQTIAAARTTETIKALEAAKLAFDSSADLNAFGDAVNAAIDVVNACQAVNAEYANLDEAGAAVAADVLAKYENKEYANIAELRAAYILAAKAQTTAGANMTGAIVNPEINGADGWTTEKPLGGNGPLLNNSSFEYWAGNTGENRSKASFDYYQVITGLPNGAYTVTADMYNSLNGEGGATWNATSGVYGKGANESVTLVNEDGVTLKPYTTGQVFVVDGTIRIGVKNTVTPMAARWFVADNFKLTYLGETPEYAEATKPYAIAIAEGIENGTIAADVETAEEGATVTLTATPAEGYKLEAITVTAGEASVEVTEAEGAYTFVMPAAAVTVSATFVAEAVEPEPVDPNLIEIAQTIDDGTEVDGFVNQATKNVTDEYTEYTFKDNISLAFKMLNVDVKDCDYVVIKFAEPTPAGLKASFVEGEGNEDIPEGVTEWKNIIADNTAVKDGIIPQITLLTIFGTAGTSVKVEGVYKHKIASEPVEPTTFTIAIAEGIENGTIAADVETAEEGATVTLTATPAEGYKLEAITVTAGEASVEVTEAEGAYTFVMPAAAVTVSATFAAEAVEPTPELPAIAQEFTSIEEIAGQSFVIINKQTGKILFGTDAQNLGYDNSEAAIKETNSGYNFKLDTPAVDAEDETIANCYLLRLMTPAGEAYNIWGNPGYLNSQPATGNCSFILGLNNQNGQDIKNGAVWDIQYVEGKGFTLLNKGTGLYLNDNAPAKYDEPVYWTFCTLQAETEPELAKVENMTLTVAEDAVIEDDKTFPVVFGYTATVDESIAAMAPAGWISYTVTAEGKEPINGEIDFDVDKDARNIPIPGLDNETDYTITINSVSVSYFDFDILDSKVVFEKKFEAGELTATFNSGVPVGINGVAAGVKANRKVVENGRVVIYKNGVKTMSSGVSIR